VIPLSSPQTQDDGDCNVGAMTRSLRGKLESKFDGLIGLYKLPNVERKIKAVAVLNDAEDEQFPPDGTEIEGLEIVIRCPARIPQPMLSGYQVELEWTVHLKQWDRSKSLDSLYERIFKLENVKQVLPVPASTKLGIPRMVQVLIHEFMGMGDD
jgi:hypothetical protein